MTWDTLWDEIYREREWGKYPSEELIRFIAQNYYKATDRSQIKILEAGCGAGANLWYLAREGFTVYGIDGSEVAVSRAQQRLNVECPGWSGRLQVGDIIQLPYPDQYFDAVIDHAAICCNSYEDSQKIYNELSRVTKPGGKLYCRTLAKDCWGDETGQQVGHHAWITTEGPTFNRGYCRFTDYDEITDLIKEFDIVEIELLSKTVNSLHDAVKEWIIVGEKL
jgi:SAM-dependent methyltransferase